MLLRQGPIKVFAAFILITQLGAAAKYLDYQNTKNLCTTNASLASEVRSYALLNAIYADLGELKYSLKSEVSKSNQNPKPVSSATTLGDLIGTQQVETIEKDNLELGREIRTLSLRSKMGSIQANKMYLESMDLQLENCQNIETSVNWIYYLQTILMIILSLLTIISPKVAEKPKI